MQILENTSFCKKNYKENSDPIANNDLKFKYFTSDYTIININGHYAILL